MHSAHFNSLLIDGKQWYTPKEMALVIGRTDQYVRDCFDNGRILGHTLSGRGRGEAKRRSFQIHRDAVLLFLLETANYTPTDFADHLAQLLSKRAKDERQYIFKKAFGQGALTRHQAPPCPLGVRYAHDHSG